MPRQKSEQLSLDEFMAKHESEFAEADDQIEIDSSLPAQSTAMEAYSGASFKPTPFSRRMQELRQWWLVRLLTAAGRENSSEAYRELLEYWLRRMGAPPPAGVFVPHRSGDGATRQGLPPRRTPDLATSRKRLDLSRKLAQELATLKPELRRFCTPASLKAKHPGFEIWKELDESEIRELIEGAAFTPKSYADTLVLRKSGLTSRQTLKKDRRKLRHADGK